MAASTPAVALPKALTFDQLQKYKNANFGEFTNAFNTNNYGFKTLDDFASAHYNKFGIDEITAGSRTNPFLEAPAPTPPPAVTAPPPPVEPPAAPAGAPASGGYSQADLDASIASAMAKYAPPAPPVVEKVAVDPVKPVIEKVKESETSQGRLSGMLKQGSPYLDQAVSLARDEMNGRGLLSSSMAAGAATGAAIGAAKDFAMQDSTLFANQRLANQQQSNEMLNANANRGLDAGKFNAGSQNEFSMAGYKAKLDTSLTALTSALRSTEMKVGAGLDMMKMKYGADLDITKMNIGQGLDLEKMRVAQINDLAKMGVGQGMDLEKMRVGQGFDMEKLAAANGYDLNKMGIANDYETQRLILSNDLDVASKEKLLGISFKYDELARSSTTAASYIGNNVTEINRILSDPNIPLDQKQQLVDKTNENTSNALKILDAIYKADFGNLMPPAPPAPPPPPAAPAAPGVADQNGNPAQGGGYG